MKKIILIVFMFMSINTFAEQGKLDATINGSLSTGAGFGIAYNVTDKFRVKVAAFYVGLFGENSNGDTDNISFYSLGGSLSFDLKTLKDQKSSLYMFLGTTNFLITSSDGYDDDIMNIISVGLGLRKFFDSKMFWEVEIGYSLYISDSYDNDKNTSTLPSAGFNIGYQF